LEKASDWTIFWQIILPLTSPTALFVFIMTITFGLSYVFTPINILTQGGPTQASTNIIYLIYQYGFDYFQTGRAAATAIVTLVIFMVLVVIQKKLEKIIERAVQILSEHAKKSSFEIAGFELDFGPDRFFETDEIQLNEHVSMQLQGRIDRVDGTIIDKEIFVRIIDFKSSAHDLDLEEVLFGISLQMLTYLDIVLDDWQKIAPTIIEKQNSSGDIQSSHPAGVLYFHLKNPIIESEANEMDIDAILREFKMSGKILDDMKVIEKMDTSLSVDERTSKIIPVEIKKDETISARSKKNVLPESSFNHLRDYVNELYEHAGNQIMSGDVKIHPYKLKDKIPCTFCEYRSVCQFDLSLEKNKYHQTAPLNKGIDDIVGMKKNEGEE